MQTIFVPVEIVAAAARMFRLTKDEDDMGGGGDAGEDLSITDWSDEWKVCDLSALYSASLL